MQPPTRGQSDSPNGQQPQHASSNHGGIDSNTQGNEHAAGVLRQQIDRLYGDSNHAQHQEQSRANNPYQRTHQQNTLNQTGHSEALKQYHSAWQNYYKQYYERYYLQQLEARRAEQAASDRSHKTGSHLANPPETKSQSEATSEIQKELVSKVKTRAKKVRSSTHFMPIMSAIIVGLLFLGIQYNRLFVAQVKAYVSPGSTSSQNIIVDPTTDTKVSQEPRLVIPKINVDAPVVYDVGSLQENDIQNALRSGIVHYPLPGANSLPGQAGNAVFLGHSSNDVFDTGQYKFVFVLLERMEKGDTFYVHYKGVRYTYSVTSKEIIDPTEVSKLIIDTDKPMATLVTCVPPGTALKRLVVYADQISPDPGQATAAPDGQSGDNDEPNLPGNAPTLFERLFGN